MLTRTCVKEPEHYAEGFPPLQKGGRYIKNCKGGAVISNAMANAIKPLSNCLPSAPVENIVETPPNSGLGAAEMGNYRREQSITCTVNSVSLPLNAE